VGADYFIMVVGTIIRGGSASDGATLECLGNRVSVG